MTPDALAALHARCFPDRPWRAQEFSDLINARGVIWITAAGEDAFVFARYVPPEAEILTIAVAPEARRQGKAQSLLTSLMDALPSVGVTELFLEVAADNMAALALYRGSGFDEVGRRRGYYRRTDAPSVDALTLQCDLTQRQA